MLEADKNIDKSAENNAEKSGGQARPDEFNGAERVHLIGVGGSGMSGLALLLAGRGFQVSGCDLARSDYITRLEESDIVCDIGHDPSHIEKFSPHLIIYSSAIPADHEEIAAAREKGIPAIGRGLALSRLFNASRGVGVAGAHGKSTTSSMIAMILERAGRDPTLAVGAEVRDLGTNARVGSGDIFVAEIDESDGSFEFFRPAVTVITNVDWDHVNYFHSKDETVEAFIHFARARKPGGPLVVCAEDAGSRLLLDALKGDPGAVTYGWGKSWDWGVFDLTRKPGGGSAFSVARGGKTLGRVEMSAAGDHNIMNALAACAAADALGVPFAAAAEALSGFRGARRRLEKIGAKQAGGSAVEVVDDYGHHPTEITASLLAMRDIYPGRRLAVVFQPHRYTRTSAFYREIASALKAADLVVLLPVYAAGETPQGITSADIAGIMNADGRHCVLCGGEDDALRELDSLLRGGDVLLTLGAGNVSRLGKEYLQRTP